MTETDTLPQNTAQVHEEFRNTRLLIAIPAYVERDALASLITKLSRAVQVLPSSYPVGVALPQGTLTHLSSFHDPVDVTLHPLEYLDYVPPAATISTQPWLASALTAESIFYLAQQSHADACTVVSADVRESLTPERMSLLLEPCIEGNMDLVMPIYATPAFDDLLNKAILYPLTRALYGRRIQNPLANEFQVSSKMMQFLQAPMGKDPQLKQGRLLWLGYTAANFDLKICQVYLGERNPQTHDGIELSDALIQMVGPLFLNMEDNAVFWQRVRGSREVPTFENVEPIAPSARTMDVRQMVETFRLGFRNLHEIWSLILPPATLLELKKISLLPAEGFHLSDELWARIVYDFALAHRLRNVHRLHLFGALLPLYLGWVASYVNDVMIAGIVTADDRVEALARAYEAEKAYLVSRWRWPDRFHP